VIEHVWSVLCARSSVDRATNAISLFDVLEQIQMYTWRSGDALPGPFELVSLWSRGSENLPDRRQARMSFRGPSGRLLTQEHQEIDLREFRRMRARYRLAALPIHDGPGVYYFTVELEDVSRERWDEVAKIPLDIIVRSQG
jgi:hypothetical protein